MEQQNIVVETSPICTKQTKTELIKLCKERGIKGYNGRKKEDIVKALLSTEQVANPPEKVYRLDYIGSKYQLLDWLTANMKEKTGWDSFSNKRIADLFSGTGIVAHHFRNNDAIVTSNDSELYSSIITHAFTRSVYTENCKKIINDLQTEIDSKDLTSTGYITQHYSPFETSERMFFTVENAKRIDYIRQRIEALKDSITPDDYMFILASLIISADAVSNVPAVYGCFLKKFKAKALKTFTLRPIHTNTIPSQKGSQTYNSDVLNLDFIRSFEHEFDLVYLDPPYNQRQYSKNYFPLNMIAKTPESLLSEPLLSGKTGIPSDCFISPFCKKEDIVIKAFDTLFKELKTKWIFLSYNSESIVSKDKLVELMKKYGEVDVIERDYKRFKSFKYNKDVDIKEYLFSLKKH